MTRLIRNHPAILASTMYRMSNDHNYTNVTGIGQLLVCCGLTISIYHYNLSSQNPLNGITGPQVADRFTVSIGLRLFQHLSRGGTTFVHSKQAYQLATYPRLTNPELILTRRF